MGGLDGIGNPGRLVALHPLKFLVQALECGAGRLCATVGAGSAMTQLRITTESGDGWHRVVPADELDIAVAEQLRAVIVEIAGSTVVVDLSGHLH